MDLIGLLVALFPKAWRQAYGDELAALLEDTRLTPGVVLDVVVQAGKLRIEHRHREVAVMVLLAWSSGLEILAVHTGLTANILWVPTSPLRGLALMATFGPWAALAGWVVNRWRGTDPTAWPGDAAS